MTPVYIFEEMRLPLELLSAALLFLLPYAEKKDHFLFRAVSGMIAAVLFSLLFFPIFLDKETPRLVLLTLPWYLLISLLAFFYARFCFRIERADAFFFMIAAFLSQNIVYCLYHCYIARILFPALRTMLPLYIAGSAAASALVYCPIYLLFKKPLREAKGTLFATMRNAWPGLIVFYLITMFCLFFYQNAFDIRVSVFDDLAWFSGIIICVLLLIIQYTIIVGITRIREQVTLENMLRSSEHYYEMTKEQIAIINRKCHDLKHQLKALERAGDSERADYIREVRDSVDFYQQLVYTDNEALNTILAEKSLFCRDKGITFNCAVDSVDLSFMRLPDLYSILGNAIDNAIEYVEKQTDPNLRSVSLRIVKKNMFAGLQITNPYIGAPISSSELPKTSKSNPDDHGFGLKSIRYTVEKYGGTMEYSTAGGLFTLQILLPLYN